MAAGIGSMNWYYERFSDTAGITTTQPSKLNVSNYVDAGEGWSRYRYINFNDDYVKNGGSGIVSAYVRHDDDNNPVGFVSAYRRSDDDCNPVPDPGNNVPNA